MAKKAEIRADRFPYEYIIDLNGKKAAIRCGYSPKTAESQASRLLRKDKVKAKIKELLDAANKKALKGRDEVERILDSLLDFNLRDFVKDDGTPKEIHELTREQAACVKELGVIETQLGTSRTLKFFDKVQALKLKMQRLGMLKDPGTERMADTFEKWLDAIRAGKGK